MANHEGKYRNRIELLQGTLDMLILHAIERQPRHGYAIAQGIRERSSEALRVETGSLYPALHRLERQGWVSAEWKLTESRQRAKFYALTETGREQLATENGRWQQMVEAIAAVMRPEEAQA